MNNLPYVIADAAITTAADGAAAPTAAVTDAAAQAGTAQPADAGVAAPAQAQPSPLMSMLPFVLIFALFYFMMIRPQQRKEKERRKMIDELRAGAKVIFAGGIIGTIVEANEKTFVIETTDGRMEVLRSCVQGVVGSDEAAK